jgi:hypothetical protein
MATILHYIQGEAFQPHDVKAMSMALDDVCKELRTEPPSTGTGAIGVAAP